MKVAFWTWILVAAAAASAEDSFESEEDDGVWSDLSAAIVANSLRGECARARAPCTYIPSYKPICYSVGQCKEGELCCWDHCLGHKTCVKGTDARENKKPSIL
ncbi:uncharacterized protein LOC125041615 [Penaeus chinensis]|uniref:uncharacterized protein LOC125041615 n=1 Tax=Penaeus chinensis TaxID=139456 RepID=UPI001FB6040C|nr:uncharacterized protein LOC125041615 [Penaeus chinensis]